MVKFCRKIYYKSKLTAYYIYYYLRPNEVDDFSYDSREQTNESYNPYQTKYNDTISYIDAAPIYSEVTEISKMEHDIIGP